MANISKRNRKMPNGKTRTYYRVRYRDFSRNIRERCFQKKSEAIRFQESIGGILSGRATGVSDMVKFVELGHTYIEACKRGRDGRPPVADSTYDSIKRYFEKHLIPVMGKFRLAQLSHGLMLEISSQIIERTKTRQTARHIFVLARAILAYGKRHAFIKENPADGIVVSIDRRQSRTDRMKSFDVDEVRRIFDAALKLRSHRNKSIQNARRQYYPFAILLFNNGLRYSKISGLKKDDFDFKRKTVTIKRTADKNGKVGRLRSAYAERTIPLPEMVVNEIRALSKQKQNGFLFSTASCGHL